MWLTFEFYSPVHFSAHSDPRARRGIRNPIPVDTKQLRWPAPRQSPLYGRLLYFSKPFFFCQIGKNVCRRIEYMRISKIDDENNYDFLSASKIALHFIIIAQDQYLYIPNALSIAPRHNHNRQIEWCVRRRRVKEGVCRILFCYLARNTHII